MSTSAPESKSNLEIEDLSSSTSSTNKDSLTSTSTSTSPSTVPAPVFSHYKYSLVKDKLVEIPKEEITVDTNQMSRGDEQATLLDSLTSYLHQYMIFHHEMEEHFIPFDNAPVKCSILLSKDYQEKEKLIVFLQNKSGSQMGIWSRSACMEQSLEEGSMLPWLAQARSQDYGVVIMNPNCNSMVDPNSSAGERKLIPQSEHPTAHVLGVWENYISTKVCQKAKKIVIIANGHGSILAKDIVQKEMLMTENLQENRIAAIAMIEASCVIEEDDSVDVARFMSRKAINFDFSTNQAMKTGFVLPEEHRPNRHVLGVSQSVGIKVEGDDYYNAIAYCRDEIFTYFNLAMQQQDGKQQQQQQQQQTEREDKDYMVDVGFLFAAEMAKARGGPQPVPMPLPQQGTHDEEKKGEEEKLGFFARLFGRQNSSKGSDVSGSPGKFSSKENGKKGQQQRQNNGGENYSNAVSKNGSNGNNTFQMSTHISIEDFDLIKVVGKGAFGKVMLVRKKGDRRDAKPLAMKVLKKAVIEEKRQIEHTKSEREILFKVKHPYIVSLRYAFQNDYNLYLVMDYYPGGALFFHLRKQERFSEERARFYASELLLALQHLHNHYILYRDLKLENILMDEGGHVALTDFGLSKQDVKTSDGASTFCGTAEYIAPELLRGLNYGKAVDWWSFGILLFEMMTGYTPFFHKNKNYMFHCIQNVPPQFDESFSPEAIDVLSALLETNPRRRLGSSERGGLDIRETDFFNVMNWESLESRTLSPPFKIPNIRSPNDTRYITPGYKNMEAKDSIAVGKKGSTHKKAQFQGFTYTGDSVLDQEDA